ncbi:MAG: hypothetical protein IPK64_16195 [bacterium]|nr:hypothetical protein [bacterium]
MAYDHDAIGHYRDQYDKTVIATRYADFGELETVPSFNIEFPGSTTGEWSEATGVVVSYWVHDGGIDTGGFIAQDGSSGSHAVVRVTQYDRSGGYIRGTFSGVLKFALGDRTTTITDGAFQVQLAP